MTFFSIDFVGFPVINQPVFGHAFSIAASTKPTCRFTKLKSNLENQLSISHIYIIELALNFTHIQHLSFIELFLEPACSFTKPSTASTKPPVTYMLVLFIKKCVYFAKTDMVLQSPLPLHLRSYLIF